MQVVAFRYYQKEPGFPMENRRNQKREWKSRPVPNKTDQDSHRQGRWLFYIYR